MPRQSAMICAVCKQPEINARLRVSWDAWFYVILHLMTPAQTHIYGLCHRRSTWYSSLDQDNLALKAEVKERESELEDLGCWRAILLRRRRPTKKLTQVIMITNVMCDGDSEWPLGILNGHWRFSNQHPRWPYIQLYIIVNSIICSIIVYAINWKADINCDDRWGNRF